MHLLGKTNKSKDNNNKEVALSPGEKDGFGIHDIAFTFR